MDKPGYTAEEMRDRLGVTSVRTVYRRAQRGEIGVVRVGRRTYYHDRPLTPAVTDTRPDATVSDDLLTLVRALVAAETRELTDRVTLLEAEVAALRAAGEAERVPPKGHPAQSDSDDRHDDEVTTADTPRRRGWLRRFLFGPE